MDQSGRSKILVRLNLNIDQEKLANQGTYATIVGKVAIMLENAPKLEYRTLFVIIVGKGGTTVEIAKNLESNTTMNHNKDKQVRANCML